MKLGKYKSKYRICLETLIAMAEDSESMDELISVVDFTMRQVQEMKENMKAEI